MLECLLSIVAVLSLVLFKGHVVKGRT